jgi:hypothetical protein
VLLLCVVVVVCCFRPKKRQSTKLLRMLVTHQGDRMSLWKIRPKMSPNFAKINA